MSSSTTTEMNLRENIENVKQRFDEAKIKVDLEAFSGEKVFDVEYEAEGNRIFEVLLYYCMQYNLKRKLFNGNRKTAIELWRIAECLADGRSLDIPRKCGFKEYIEDASERRAGEKQAEKLQQIFYDVVPQITTAFENAKLLAEFYQQNNSQPGWQTNIDIWEQYLHRLASMGKKSSKTDCVLAEKIVSLTNAIRTNYNNMTPARTEGRAGNTPPLKEIGLLLGQLEANQDIRVADKSSRFYLDPAIEKEFAKIFEFGRTKDELEAFLATVRANRKDDEQQRFNLADQMAVHEKKYSEHVGQAHELEDQEANGIITKDVYETQGMLLQRKLNTERNEIERNRNLIFQLNERAEYFDSQIDPILERIEEMLLVYRNNFSDVFKMVMKGCCEALGEIITFLNSEELSDSGYDLLTTTVRNIITLLDRANERKDILPKEEMERLQQSTKALQKAGGQKSKFKFHF